MIIDSDRVKPKLKLGNPIGRGFLGCWKSDEGPA
jgi:hypothetical protein